MYILSNDGRKLVLRDRIWIIHALFMIFIFVLAYMTYTHASKPWPNLLGMAAGWVIVIGLYLFAAKQRIVVFDKVKGTGEIFDKCPFRPQVKLHTLRFDEIKGIRYRLKEDEGAFLIYVLVLNNGTEIHLNNIKPQVTRGPNAKAEAFCKKIGAFIAVPYMDG